MLLTFSSRITKISLSLSHKWAKRNAFSAPLSLSSIDVTFLRLIREERKWVVTFKRFIYFHFSVVNGDGRKDLPDKWWVYLLFVRNKVSLSCLDNLKCPDGSGRFSAFYFNEHPVKLKWLSSFPHQQGENIPNVSFSLDWLNGSSGCRYHFHV